MPRRFFLALVSEQVSVLPTVTFAHLANLTPHKSLTFEPELIRFIFHSLRDAGFQVNYSH